MWGMYKLGNSTEIWNILEYYRILIDISLSLTFSQRSILVKRLFKYYGIQVNVRNMGNCRYQSDGPHRCKPSIASVVVVG